MSRSIHADTLLSQSISPAWIVMPAVNFIQEIQGIFSGAYSRQDTLQMVPLDKNKAKTGGK